jgi:hypothetical protein
MRCFFPILLVTFYGLLLAAKPQEPGATGDCTFDDACGSGFCKVWERSRFVCEPKQYVMVVWDRGCLDKIELGKDSRMEAPLGEDQKPDLTRSTISHTQVTYTKGCQFRYEVRNR